jgi:hypothetical protein
MGRRKNNLKKKRNLLKKKRMEECLEYYTKRDMKQCIDHFWEVLKRESEKVQSYKWN